MFVDSASEATEFSWMCGRAVSICYDLLFFLSLCFDCRLKQLNNANIWILIRKLVRLDNAVHQNKLKNFENFKNDTCRNSIAISAIWLNAFTALSLTSDYASNGEPSSYDTLAVVVLERYHEFPKNSSNQSGLFFKSETLKVSKTYATNLWTY